MADLLQRPLSESYWVKPGRFLAGEYPGHFDGEMTRKRIDALLEAGFDTFIDLTRPHELLPYEQTLRDEAGVFGVEVKRYPFPIGDLGLPTPSQMTAILDTIDQGLQERHRIYLHCWGGIGRTGTTVGCYLVRHGKTGEEALNQLAEWWRGVPKSRYHRRSPETDQQVAFIRGWARYQHDARE